MSGRIRVKTHSTPRTSLPVPKFTSGPVGGGPRRRGTPVEFRDVRGGGTGKGRQDTPNDPLDFPEPPLSLVQDPRASLKTRRPSEGCDRLECRGRDRVSLPDVLPGVRRRVYRKPDSQSSGAGRVQESPKGGKETGEDGVESKGRGGAGGVEPDFRLWKSPAPEDTVK